MTVSAPSGCDDTRELLRLAAAEVGARVRMRSPLQQAVEHDGARGLGQGGELAHRVLGVLQRALRVHADEHDVLEPQLSVLDLGDVFELGRQTGDAAQRRAVFAIELLAVVRRVVDASRRWSACAPLVNSDTPAWVSAFASTRATTSTSVERDLVRRSAAHSIRYSAICG